ncbi:fatty-acid amide hydrolase 2-A-like [Sycon ciliatum]|uniref:fatty-acid amide hydrolase 2-A-like n=1 Tax=Sycon ciliatum TaxID=27933 RepID=UPI0020AA2063|eukprot:scpid47490/ scgid25822/ Fatty-acid amide hydrolase 2; Amidase domain-containing protein; Anandamide amidohydrolase 2; Oleamide hydrolase 2
MGLPILLRMLGWVRAIMESLMSVFSALSPSASQSVSVDKIDPEDRGEDYDNSLLLLSATQLSKRIREGSVSSQKVVATYIRRVRRVNTHLNAMVLDTFDSATAEARKVDASLADGTAPSRQFCPLYGVPFTCKECFAVQGLPNTAGLCRRRDIMAEADAPVVRRLRAAGGILIGISNVSELCLWYECHNPLYGRSNNPYNAQCTPGGSSGGEAALVGAGASMIGVGSDVGGSIRMPAFFCGVFGHKPSPGLVPNDGQYPCATNAHSRKMLTTGPICRYAEDLELMLKIMATDPADIQCLTGHGFSCDEQSFLPQAECCDSLVAPTDDVSDSNASVGISLQRAASKFLGDSDHVSSHSDWPVMHAAAVAALCSDQVAPVDLSSLHYISILDAHTATTVLQSPLAQELADVQQRVNKALADRFSVTVKETSLRKLRCTSDLWSVGMAELGGPDMSQRLYDLSYNHAGAWPSVKELCKWCVGQSNHTFIAILTALLSSQIRNIPESKLLKMRQIRSSLESELEQLIGENGVLIFPSHPTLAPYHNYPLITPMNYAYTALFNLTGMPVTQCPLGLSADGRPLGVQIVSLQGNDRITIAVGQFLQEAFGGWSPPGGV